MNKLTKFCLFLIFAASLNFLGWGNNSNKITNYYYYKNQPFYLKLKTDKLFVKFDKEFPESAFRSRISSISPVNDFSAAYDEKDKRYFIDLNTDINESGLLDLTEHIKSMPDVQYCSPVFSPDDGKTLIGVEDEIIVQFKPSVNQNEINSFLQNRNLAIIQQLSLTGGASYVLRVEKYEQAIDAANEVYSSGLVSWAEPNLYFTNLLCFDPNDTYYSLQWSQKNLGNNIPGGITGNADCDMDVDSAWDITTGISQCKIAINRYGHRYTARRFGFKYGSRFRL